MALAVRDLAGDVYPPIKAGVAAVNVGQGQVDPGPTCQRLWIVGG